MDDLVSAHAPGRVNLIGDHTDYTGGLVLPMAIGLGTTVTVRPGGDEVVLRSDADPREARVPLEVGDPSAVQPQWARYVAGVVAEMRPGGAAGSVTSTLPVGAGLSSSAALQTGIALALGFSGSPIELAQMCRRAEQRSSGVPCGIMDQLASAAGVAGCALLIDCRSLDLRPVTLPPGVAVVGIHSGLPRSLAGSAYVARRAECESAEARIGPLRDAGPTEVARLEDPVLRRRARHVVSENARVLSFVDCLTGGDLRAAGSLMVESHRSLMDDFEVSAPAVDQLVEDLTEVPGVLGARMTGGGFGGVVVALADEGAMGRIVAIAGGRPWWRFVPSPGARRI